MLEIGNSVDFTPRDHPARGHALSDHRCFFCLGERFDRILDIYEATVEERRLFVSIMADRFADHGHDLPPTEFLRELYAVVARLFPNRHPFWPIKKGMNDLALELQSILKVRVRMSDNAFRTALRITLAGTSVDFSSATHEMILGRVSTLATAKLSIDHTDELKRAIRNGVRILYLTDQAGEIVLDKMFIRNIPGAQVTCVVNCPYAGLSASGQDADYVDMRHIASVLANGCSAPLTIPQLASDRFQDAFHAADIIIAKGQSNLEALYDYHDSRVYVLFTCKCQLVADRFGVSVGDSLVMNPELRLAELAEKSQKAMSQ